LLSRKAANIKVMAYGLRRPGPIAQITTLADKSNIVNFENLDTYYNFKVVLQINLSDSL
jgi:hypothetical protein